MTDKEYMNKLVEMLNVTQNAFDICVRTGNFEAADTFQTQMCAYRKAIDALNEEDAEEEKKYYWRLNGSYPNFCAAWKQYLNVRSVGPAFWELSIRDEVGIWRTKFTKSEYKTLANRFNFPAYMFIEEEVEE